MKATHRLGWIEMKGMHRLGGCPEKIRYIDREASSFAQVSGNLLNKVNRQNLSKDIALRIIKKIDYGGLLAM